MGNFELNENFYKELSALFDKMNLEPLIIIGRDKGNGSPQLNIIGPYPIDFYKGLMRGAAAQFDNAGDQKSGIIIPFGDAKR
jgi:hypothetical protein